MPASAYKMQILAVKGKRRGKDIAMQILAVKGKRRGKEKELTNTA